MQNILTIASQSLYAQNVRLNSIASNMANAGTVSGDPARVYQPQEPVFSTTVEGGVAVTEMAPNPRPPIAVHDPHHPLANEQGMVYRPAVDPVHEKVNMLAASRAYEEQLEVFQTARQLVLATLAMGR